MNEDIPVDKKPRKARKKSNNRMGGASTTTTNTRLNQMLTGLAPSIQLYSPSP